MADINAQIQQILKLSNMISINKGIPKYIIVKLLAIKEREGLGECL
jgi:hypothetical protein